MGVEGEHSKPFIPGEAGEGESKLEQPGPSWQSGLSQRAATQNTAVAPSRGGLGHEKKISKLRVTDIGSVQAEPAPPQLTPAQGEASCGGPSP